MKILLTTLNSKYVHSNLALKYLYSVSEGSGLDIDLKEFTINNEMGYIYTEILRGGYDLVCFSVYIWNVAQIRRLCADLKKARPDMKIMAGGPEVSHETLSFMKENPWVDYVLRGEGELPFFNFLKALILADEKLENADLSSVAGLSFRKSCEAEKGAAGSVSVPGGTGLPGGLPGELPGGLPGELPGGTGLPGGLTGFSENPDGPAVPMDKLPFPYRAVDIEPDKVVYYESARGCPYRCSYCLSSLEKTMRPLSLSRVRQELGYFLFKEVKQVKFIDRTFNYDRNRAAEIWQYLIDNDNGITNFHFEICAELLDEDLLKLLSKARPGLFQFEIGIQTTSLKTLGAVDRSTNVSVVLSNVKELIALGNSHIHVDLIAGLPYEDYQSFGRSFNAVYGLGADNLQLGFLKLLKGTKARQQADLHGYVFREEAPYEVISNTYISAEELVQLKMIEHVLELYANKGGFGRTLRFLIPIAAAAPFQFYEKLAAFFYDRGFQHRSHKKEDLYRILYAFAKTLEKDFPGIGERTREVLEEDLADTMNFDAVKKFHKKGWEI